MNFSAVHSTRIHGALFTNASHSKLLTDWPGYKLFLHIYILALGNWLCTPLLWISTKMECKAQRKNLQSLNEKLWLFSDSKFLSSWQFRLEYQSNGMITTYKSLMSLAWVQSWFKVLHIFQFIDWCWRKQPLFGQSVFGKTFGSFSSQ